MEVLPKTEAKGLPVLRKKDVLRKKGAHLEEVVRCEVRERNLIAYLSVVNLTFCNERMQSDAMLARWSL